VADEPRLMFIVNAAWFFASHRLPLARAAIAAGFRVHLASDWQDPAEIAAIEQAGVQFHHVHLARSGVNPMAEVRTLHELWRAVRTVRPDIIHNVTAKPVVYGSFVARRLATPGVVNAISGFGYAYAAADARRRLIRAALDVAYARVFRPSNVRVIVQNEDDRREVERICPASSARLRLVPGSGVDLDEFRYSPETDAIPVVVLPARLLRDKGVCEFAAAATQLRDEGVAARFLLAGRLDPGNRAALTLAEVRELCTRTGVEWIGECKDMPALLRESHVVCLPSYREGMPKVLLEACATGRAVVTTDTPGCRDVVPAGRNGILVPPRDAPALAAALRLLIADPALRQSMGTLSRQLAESRFGIESVVRAHLEIYCELLARARTVS
jgi:glycosyltransferase involved in cell wall biosynthesis